MSVTLSVLSHFQYTLSRVVLIIEHGAVMIPTGRQKVSAHAGRVHVLADQLQQPVDVLVARARLPGQAAQARLGTDHSRQCTAHTSAAQIPLPQWNLYQVVKLL